MLGRRGRKQFKKGRGWGCITHVAIREWHCRRAGGQEAKVGLVCLEEEEDLRSRREVMWEGSSTGREVGDAGRRRAGEGSEGGAEGWR